MMAKGCKKLCTRLNYEYRNLIGIFHNNPLLYTSEYKLVLNDGSAISYGYNVITENMYVQCNDEGGKYLLKGEISDHRYNDTAISMEMELSLQEVVKKRKIMNQR